MLQPYIEGELVYLSELKKEELPLLLELYEDEEFMEDFGYIEGVVQTYESLYTWYEELKLSEDEIFYSVYEKKTQDWSGCSSLMDINEGEREGWLVIGLTQIKRGKGFGKEAMFYLINEAFHQGLTTIRLSVLSHNERAIRLYKKLGFKLEMIYPKEQFPNFFQVDIIELSLEETEFNSR
ncbi:GNAT family N-acetyltransferase [Turicibacter sanguinis]|uniref:GNAT family N-acetyltransferase n=1 Tax=Turicibacter sanguinis TaxID=154288 RepID=UPI00399B531C